MLAELWNSGPEERFYIIVILSYIPVLIFGLAMSGAVRSTFKKFRQIPARAGATAAQVCRHMLDQNNCQHVAITMVAGTLTDHYDPRNKTVALSQAVRDSVSVAAIGVACHEAGHAVQHDRKYVFSALRTALVPVVNFANRLFFPLLIIGLVLGFMSYFFGIWFIYAGLIVFGLSMLFSLITLPTEFNASRRAMSYLKSTGYFSAEELAGSRKVLTAAAMTYVAAFLMSTVQFLRFLVRLLLIMRRR